MSDDEKADKANGMVVLLFICLIIILIVKFGKKKDSRTGGDVYVTTYNSHGRPIGRKKKYSSKRSSVGGRMRTARGFGGSSRR